MKLLIILPHQPHTTGNHVTASRFAAQLKSLGWDVRRIETGLDDGSKIADTLHEDRPDVVLLLHAYRSGRPWLQTALAREIPFAVLMTGTDLNRDLDIPERAAVIRQVHQQAAAIIVQNRLVFTQLTKADSPWRKKLQLLPPGTQLGTQEYPLRNRLQLNPQELLLLHPASIRPVKGNLELLEMCDPLIQKKIRIRLAFCGPVLDRAYAERFFAALKKRPWAYNLGEIPCAAMPAAMRQADLILNNSFSEGVANALVEAAVLGRPILARDIPGNRAVIRPAENGLLYTSAEEFRQQVLQLADSPARLQHLAHPDPKSYTALREGIRLASILERLSLPQRSRLSL